MTPAGFVAEFRATAEAVSRGTGIDPMALLAQWACETAWGRVVVGNNLGNIRCSSTSFCRYATLDDFVTACVRTWHNGYYAAVLAAKTADTQLQAICDSPWSAGHYGGSLQSFYTPLEVLEMTPAQAATLDIIHQGLFGGDPSVLTPPIQDVVHGLPAKLDAILAAVKAPGPTTVDLAPVLDAIADVKAALGNIPVGTLAPAQAKQLQEARDAVLRIETGLKAA